MARYAILNTVEWEGGAGPSPWGGAPREPTLRRNGCVWLFRVHPRVDDVAEAAREAVRDFFGSPEGERVRRLEALETLAWGDALPWVSDEVWERHGLEAIRHPDLECVEVEADEELAPVRAPLPSPPAG